MSQNRIVNDKYYTPPHIAKLCIDRVYEIIGEDNISEIIEPSAGNGSFSNQIENCIAYDIEPEHENIVEQDYLSLDIDYKPKRLIIGNPPFGSRMNLAQKFFKKSVEIADYIAFILPISQLANTNSLYEFDLIASMDLGKQWYTDRELHCCFNIYKRPESGRPNKKKRVRLKDITIVRQDSNRYDGIKDYDVRMCYWGQSAGRLLSPDESYAGEYKIIIHNKKLKNEVIKVLENINWQKELNFIAMPKIQQFHIHNVLKKYVEGIQ